MRIIHLCLSSFYIDGYNYQENVLPRINFWDGNDVLIIASTETYIDNKEYGYKEPGAYNTEFGVPIKRLPYRKILTDSLTHKVRAYIGVYEELEAYKPDVIFAHGLTFWSILEVSKYVRNHPNVILYTDTHAAAYNSGTTWLSRFFLHRLFYRSIIKKALGTIKKVFYVGEAEHLFAKENYRIPEEKMEFYPLGGELLSDSKYEETRRKKRRELDIENDIRVYLHTGKMNKQKRTIELLKAFSAVEDEKARLIVIGSVSKDIEKEFYESINKDRRIQYLGWKTGEELQDYLCAGDLYCQPGSVSATMQNAVCRYCAVMAYPHLPYTHDLDYGNILWINTEEDIENVFKSISDSPNMLEQLKINSKKCALELLDYRKLASRIYH